MNAPMAGDYAYSTVPTDDPGKAEDPESKAADDARFKELRRLRTEVGKFQQLEDQARKQYANLNSFWGGKAKDLENGIEQIARKRRLAEDEQHILEHPHEDL